MKTNLIAAIILTILIGAAGRAEAGVSLRGVTKAVKISSLKVTIGNETEVKADGIKVSVYAFAPAYHLFGDATQPYEYSLKIKSGEVTKFALPLDFFIKDRKEADYYTDLAWTKTTQTFSVNAKSSADLIVNLPDAYQISKKIINPDDLEASAIFTPFYTKSPKTNVFFGVPPENLTFDQSSIYVQIEHPAAGIRDERDFFLPAPKSSRRTLD